MVSQEVICPNCSERIPAGNINIKALVAKCSNCDHVSQLPIAGITAADAVGKEPPPSRPGGIVHESGPGAELYLKRSWFKPSLFFLLFFCIAWDGFLVFWYSTALFAGAGNWIMILFPIGHVAVGVSLTYYVVAGFLNSTQVFVDQHSLFVRHRPVPWFGNRDVSAKEIQGFEIDHAYDEDSQPRFAVSANHSDGRQIVLLSSLNEKQARYIAYHLASYLGIEYGRNDVKPKTGRWPSWLEGSSE